MSPAPVQVLVLGLEDATFDGSVLAELTRLGEAGVVRLVDVLVVRRADDGSLETVEGRLDGFGEVAAALLGDTGAAGREDGADDGWSLADVVPDHGVSVVALIEHLWAAPLTAALRDVGARLLEETWLSEADRSVLASLEGRDP
ncbi:MAG: hypothetical protein HOP97_08650 [Terrabacter sp.]|nr:hypothetical protein [Terrabacter sp.]